METGQRRDEDEEVMGGGGGEEQRRERRQEMEEESGEARREGESRGGKGGGSWVDSGKCLSAPSAGGVARTLHPLPPAFLPQHSRLSPSTQGQQQGQNEACFSKKQVSSTYVGPGAHIESGGSE